MSDNSNAFNKAIKLHQTGKLEEAIKIYIKLLKYNENKSLLNFFLGTAYLQKQYQQKAYKYLNQAISIDQNIPNYYNNIGIALSGLNRDREAVENFKTALKIKDNYNDAIINIGISHQEILQILLIMSFYQNYFLLNHKQNFSFSQSLIYCL